MTTKIVNGIVRDVVVAGTFEAEFCGGPYVPPTLSGTGRKIRRHLVCPFCGQTFTEKLDVRAMRALNKDSAWTNEYRDHYVSVHKLVVPKRTRKAAK